MKKNRQHGLNSKRDRRDALFFACMVALPTLHFIVFYVLVNFNSILLAFKVYDGDTYKLDIFANFARFITEYGASNVFSTAIKNSLVAALWTVGVGISLALLFSVYIYRRQYGYKFFKVMLFMPSVVSSIVIVKVFTTFTDGAVPEIVLLLTGMKIDGLMANPDTVWSAIIFFNLWVGFGSSVLMYVSAMNGISDSMLEAARLDGANIMKEAWYIILPSIYPTIVVYVTAGIAGIFMNQLSLFSFFGTSADRGIITLGYWFYNHVKTANGQVSQYPFIAAVGLLCTMVCIPVSFGIRWLMNKLGPSVD